jgi:hypothetical protein
MDDMSELWPPMGHPIWFIPQVMYEHAEPWQNDVDRERLKNVEQHLPQCHFVHHKYHMD